MTVSFGDTLERVFDERGRLCVGIDPHVFLLRAWGLGDDAAGLREFGLRVVDAAVGRAGIVKPQVAFFERHGSAGYAALEEVIAAARAAGLVVIADAKRGDVGTSVEAYGEAWLHPGSALEADAVTLNAFQGVGSIAAPLELAREHGKGVFVLAATSNPEAAGYQTATIGSGTDSGKSVARGIVAEVTRWNTQSGTGGLGSAGVVLGATVSLADYGIDPSELAAHRTPILAPGFGHQGARISDLQSLYGAASGLVIVSASRSILGAGPDGITTAISDHATEARL